MRLVFNRNPPWSNGSINGDWSQDDIKNTPSLWNASLDDAALFGGPLTRAALQAMQLQGKHKYTTVDTKVHLLQPGMYPAIPGWHTDGVPRAEDGNPSAGGLPNMALQEAMSSGPRAGWGPLPPRYYLMLVGNESSSTEFQYTPCDYEVPDEPDSRLYADITRQSKDYYGSIVTPGQGVVLEFDWWNVHRAVPAKTGGWRFLIRVTESDFLQPQTDIRKIIRLHNPVYIQQEEFGW